MGTTLKCRWHGGSVADEAICHQFLASIGWANSLRYGDEEVFFVEVQTMPSILDHLKESPDTMFDVIDVSPGGFNFYFVAKVGDEHEDGFVLVPWSNILAIHCLSPEIIRELRQRK